MNRCSNQKEYQISVRHVAISRAGEKRFRCLRVGRFKVSLGYIPLSPAPIVKPLLAACKGAT